jgi:hypothetical protein
MSTRSGPTNLSESADPGLSDGNRIRLHGRASHAVREGWLAAARSLNGE